MVAKKLWLAGQLSLLAGCGGDGTAPLLPPCTSGGFQVDLVAPGDYTAIDPGPVSGCTVFPPAPAASSVEYLLVPQAASAKPNDSQGFRLAGALVAAAGIAPQLAASQAVPAPPGPAERFDRSLRRIERELAITGAPRRVAPAAGARATAQIVPVDSGEVRGFKVCVIIECDTRKPSTLTTVTATAQKVGQHIAIFVDNDRPAGGLTQADLDALRDVFDNRLYQVDTLAFGRESDIDSNGVVIVLMTNKVNELVAASACPTTGFVVGYFFGADLLSPSEGGTGNSGEIFYSLVADPGPTLNSCAHSTADVKRIVPTTFAHEFQHMINFNEHYLKRGALPDVLWLNEALSHYAEERAGRSFLEPAPGDSAAFCTYVGLNLRNAGEYVGAPQNYFVVDTAGIGGTTERGGYWLFLRYLVDQFATNASLAAADTFTRKLVQTMATGASNVEQAAGGTPFATLVSRWALALWVSDLPGFTAPDSLRYTSWSFRTDFPAFNQSCSMQIPPTFPLVPGVGAGSAVNLSGVLRAGTGTYFRAQQDTGAAGFTLLLSDGSGRALRPSLVPRLNVIRIQ